ncbi:hypothetical protein LTR48_003841 [Friedmanniomyces endolithicus]|uniref:AA1-like domain-containing protein n=1 Tax=Rachicladosporium monterosium TaxID=1507873 RepID=A0ABR0L8C0_9PEZI|nr:hypothetical protein LTR29_004687 [Friedmanniomyces endolithicus]KAK1086177.1 hypothetical protein LTR48_003841 [Friedmanniomyces endolithicus]KAK5144542.1 hypothetical protein LTR32_003541 [Rachicladosporium monterosium]
MYAATLLLLSTLLLLATLPSALPAATSPPFQITHLQLHEVQNGNTTFAFTVHDPDPLTNATQRCTGKWTTGTSGYPQGSYETCGNSSFGWNMYAYTNCQNFVLGIEHSFTDPSVGEPPYDQILEFGKGKVTMLDLACTAQIGRVKCEQVWGGRIEAPIYAVVAKRR